MFRLKRKYEFHAARKLTALQENHPCGELHGHTFTITIKVSGNQLASEGWIMDFNDIDKLFKEKVHKKLDHKYLNDIDGLSNPTTEHIAMWIWKKLENDFLACHQYQLVKAIVMDVNTMENKMPKADGKEFNFLSEEHIDSSFLETFNFDSKNQYIETTTREFSAVCPFSGLPDLADVIIEYFPEGGKCVELKSLKYYFVSFRNVGIYQEAATKRIYDDLKALLKTSRLKITTIYNTRGGFDTTCIEGEL